ncbi:hypothetical protein J421_1573 [Gemmatirosa kalamazoonensis]|uniref:Lipoprotein n=1 Tax=Gemmatirosa kalamazoonensis TaxID=861299 RepID=W0RFJ2_9BACT|nr:hypothetical protein [Gemmatirosa kalamazoonensis]AHG89110.1 hypothetical protein J421_1573 [Gemmatirosa kalamazoonensis]
MRKLTSTFTALSAVALTVLAAACADGPTSASSTPRPSAPRLASGVSVQIGDTTLTTFTIDPLKSDTYVEAGVFKLKMTAGSICDPAVSTYGPTEWDQPCTTLVAPIAITAKSWTTASGKSIVQFSPDLRFAPDKINTLYLWKGSFTSATAAVAWCPTGSDKCYDEASADPSVAATLGTNGFLSRRVKHFSGYTSTWGFDGDSTTSYGY